MKQKKSTQKIPSLSKRSESIIFWTVLVVLCLIHSSNIVRLDVYPFIDLPNHLAEATIFKYIDDPDTTFSSFYQSRISLIKPNTLHMLFCNLFGNIELGNTIYYMLYILLVPLSIFALIRLTGGNVWFSLFSLLFLYNFNVIWGFTGFSFALPLVCIVTVVLILYLDQPSLKYGVLLSFSLLILFYTHVLGFLFAATIVAIAGLIHSKNSMVRRLYNILPLLPSLAIFLSWTLTAYEFQSEGSIFEFLKTFYLTEYVQSISQRFSTFFWQDNAGIASDGNGSAIGLFFSVCVLAPVIALGTPQNIMNHFKKTNRRIVFILTCMAISLFILLPDRLPGQGFLYQRFSILVYLGIVCMSSFIIEYKRRTLLIVYICVISIVHCLLWFDYYSSFKRDSSCFNREFLSMTDMKESRLGAIIHSRDFRGQPAYVHYQNYNIIWNHGVAVTRIIDYRFGCIRRRVGFDILPLYLEWIRRTETEPLLHHYKDMEYILTRGEKPYTELSSSGRYALVKQCDDWALFRRAEKQ